MVSAIGKSLAERLSAAELVQTVAPWWALGWRTSRFGKSAAATKSTQSSRSPLPANGWRANWLPR